MGSFECDDFYFYIFSISLRQSQLDDHKHRKLLVLENQEKLYTQPTNATIFTLQNRPTFNVPTQRAI